MNGGSIATSILFGSVFGSVLGALMGSIFSNGGIWIVIGILSLTSILLLCFWTAEKDENNKREWQQNHLATCPGCREHHLLHLMGVIEGTKTLGEIEEVFSRMEGGHISPSNLKDAKKGIDRRKLEKSLEDIHELDEF